MRLNTVPPGIGKLFERAFGKGSERDGARPSALDWVTELEKFRKGWASAT